MVKFAILKNVFAKALLRDAWVNTRLKCLLLLRLADIHMESLKMDPYTECINEFKKEIDNRIKTHEDEEVHVFHILYYFQVLKLHIRNHDFEAFLREIENINQILRKIKQIDFGLFLAFRTSAAFGYVAKLVDNNILEQQYLLHVIEIYEINYESKK